MKTTYEYTARAGGGRAFLIVGLAVLGACTAGVRGRPPGPLETGSSVTFRAASTGLPTRGIWKSTPAVADVNGDGIPDLIALPRLGYGPRIWLGTAEGGWVEASSGLQMTGSCGGGIVAADVNRDGHRDLVVADHCDGVFVFLGDGRGRWRAAVKELNAAIARADPSTGDDDNPFVGSEDVAVGDVNEDGFVDLVVAASNMGGLSVYLGDGSGTQWREIVAPDGLPSGVDPEPNDRERAGWANRVLVADVDRDGHLDVVASYHSGPRVWRGSGAARWEPVSRGLPVPEAGGVYRAIALGDVNGDGLVDLVTTNMLAGVEVYVQSREGTWQRSTAAALSALAGGATAAALGDVDGDGHLDLVVGGRRVRTDTYGVFVFLGNGRGEWREVTTGLPVGGYPFIWGITVADINRDGAPDVVVAAGVVAAPHPARGALRTVQPGDGAGVAVPPLQVWINARNSR